MRARSCKAATANDHELEVVMLVCQRRGVKGVGLLQMSPLHHALLDWICASFRLLILRTSHNSRVKMSDRSSEIIVREATGLAGDLFPLLFFSHASVAGYLQA